MQYSSLNHLPQYKPLYQLRRTPFMEIDDKGGEIGQRYESFLSFGERLEGLDMDMDKEVVTLKNKRGSNIFGQRKHTSRRSKLMNFD